MKIGMTLALVSGIITLLIGLILTLLVGAVGGTAGAMGASGVVAKSGVAMLVLLGLPIMVIVGGALAFNSPKAAVWLTGLPGALIVLAGMFDPERTVLLIVLGGAMVASAYFIYADPKSCLRQDSATD